ncbi:putative endonuclease/exonuclease/phosphatase [Lupinus albus]|uniref:Putative endonuclease/exonuclease/phosphatase n=1 Tax=Lupinus albus TaxID=3870 RepID=A0A6A4QZV2_LUPAL|nr:putative endonuclease/exonuclease/phosphatase [Lupinus albus]
MLVNPRPWCCIGDFNVVIGAHECKSSTLPVRLPIEEFKHFIEVGNLISLPTRGVDFTWSNRRRGVALTEKKLDISLCNEDWFHAWNQVSCCSFPRLSSDHHPIMLCSSSSDFIRKSTFRFHKMWLHNLDCKRVVSEAWRIVVHGCPMFVLSHEPRMLKKDLRHWNIHVFGDVHQRVKNAYNAVEVIQMCINESGLDAELLNQENMAQNDLLQALMVEETFWMEKAILNWHLHGDMNTSFFHKVTKIR